jgi:hypothetical protein
MTRQVRDLLAQQATETFVNRAEELAALLRALERDGPPVTHVHGIGGVGKSSLLEVFAAQARRRGVAVVRLDCRAIEPTERGFLHELGAAIGGDGATPEEAAERLGRLGDRVVLALDTYEVFRLMDTWLRQVFVPALGENVRVILFGREPPVAAWLTAPGWQGLFRTIALGLLSERDATELLSRAGIRDEDAQRINRFARGHPLALELAAAAVLERPELDLEEGALQRVVEELTRLYLADVRDPLTRRALNAASVVRRTTLSLLRAMLPDAAPQDAFERLRALPFVESGRDGLHIHDVVQQAIAATLRATDPNAHRGYRRAAWRQLRAEVRTVGRQDLWRYTADMLYLIENPVVREAFFPSNAHLLAIEPARPEDGADIHEITARHEGADATRLLDAWWSEEPHNFHVVRDREGAVAAYYCMFHPENVKPALAQYDPIVRAWRDHLRNNPVSKKQRVLFCRRWLSHKHGEAPSDAQAATFLDIKRTYMDLRPHLRRFYVTVCDLQTYEPIFQKLGFQLPSEARVELDGRVYNTAMLDFGPASVDGWLTGLVAAELGVEEDDLLDSEARELVLDGRRVSLTRLEFAVLQYLYQREGKVVTRQELLENVWGYDYVGGSNVVDAVVYSLRKKLGARTSLIETVTGVGYRFRRS